MTRPSRLALAALAAVFAVATAAAAQETDPAQELSVPYLVRDLDEGRNVFADPGCHVLCEPLAGSWPTQLTPAGDRLFFVASDGIAGWQVWVTEGTAESTRAVDVGACGDPSIVGSFGDRVVFHCSPLSTNDRALWISDGTPEGTAELAELPCGLFGCSLHERWLSPVVVGTAFYFGIQDEVAGLFELWRTDGTAAGTAPVDLGGDRVRSLLAHDGRLYLIAQAVAGGYVQGPTRLLRREGDGAVGELARSCGFATAIAGVTAQGDRLYLYSSCLGGLPGGPGTSLYQIDLAGGGVSEVADRVLPWELPVTTSFFRPLPDPPVLAPPAVVGDEVYFVRRPNADEELWRLRDGAVEPVTATLPAEVDKVVAAGEAPVVVDGHGLAHVFADGELVSLGLFVAPTALDLYAEAADGDLFLGASDGSIWRTDGTLEGTSPVSRPAVAAIGFTGFVRAGDRLYFAHDDGEHDVELWAAVVEEEPAFGCVEDGATLCLAAGRFAVTASWRDPRSGDEGVGHAVPETADSGFFWFFHPDNLEVLTKVLDAETVNGHHWVFHGSLTDVRYELRVEDLATGDVRSYERPAGSLCGGADTAAFPTGVEAAAGGAVVASGPATPASASLLLGAEDRFTVAVDWLDPATGAYVPATTVEETPDSGWAWFFDPANVEVFVKVLDATPVDGRHWVFHGGLTDLGYRVTVIDGLSGARRVYEKAPGSLCGGADTAAF